MLSELQNQLKEKQADIELAASVGQALLEEIDFLKKKLQETTSQDRKFSTPKSSRRLKLGDLETQSQDSQELLDKIEILKVENKNLKKKYDKLLSNNDTMNETNWNLEIQNQTINESLQNQKNLLDKSNEICKNLKKNERNLQNECEKLQNLYLSSLSRSKELETLVENIKKRENIIQRGQEDSKENLKENRSIKTQTDTQSLIQIRNSQAKSEKLRVDDQVLSTLSHLQTENAILVLKIDNLMSLNKELEVKMLNIKQDVKVNDKDSQTVFEFGQFLKLSETAQIVLWENEDENQWEIKRHMGLQVPSILQSEQHHDLLVKKKSRFSIEMKNFGSMFNELHDYKELKCSQDCEKSKFASETSERISRIHEGPGSGENMIDALVYTMIGSWFQKYNRNGKNPKLRYVWVNPYSRTLHWSNTSPSQGNPRSATKIVPINSVTWNEDVQAHKNYSPAEVDSLDLMTGNRIIRLQPLNWADRDLWITGLTVLLKRSNEKSLTEEAVTEVVQNKTWQENQSFNGSTTSSLGRKTPSLVRGTSKSHQSSPRKSMSHRRSMTIIANEETPKSSKFTFHAL